MKKITFLFMFIVCSTFVANAQLQYEGGKLRLNLGSYTNFRPSSDIYFVGKDFAFANTYGRIFSIRPASNGGAVHVGTNDGTIHFTDINDGTYQNIYAGSYYNYSDAVAKTDIRPITSAMGTILQLKPVTYKFVEQGYEKYTKRPGSADGRESGFLAQEVMRVLPNSVAVTDEDQYLVNYISIIPVLVGALQEQNARIEELENELSALKKK